MRLDNVLRRRNIILNSKGNTIRKTNEVKSKRTVYSDNTNYASLKFCHV
jgi:hypothetical protein